MILVVINYALVKFSQWKIKKSFKCGQSLVAPQIKMVVEVRQTNKTPELVDIVQSNDDSARELINETPQVVTNNK